MRMRQLLSVRLVVLPFLVLALLWAVSGLARAQDSASDLLALINAARLNQGLYPYVLNAALTAAAQRHSEDMAASGQISHTGSDDSSSTQRILEAGYGVYEFGPVVSENIFGGSGGAQAPFDEWMAQGGARSNLLSPKYREIGIGVANDAQGRAFWALDVGAQPNVLPVLVNDGATLVETITVTLRLVPENVAPDGLGTAMGQPVEYRASTSRGFVDAEWEPWAENVTFVLERIPDPQIVYVQLRDAAARTTVSQASVTLTDPNATVTPVGTEESETPVAPAVTLTTTVTVTPAETPVTSPTSTATATAAATPTPTATTTPTPTSTPTAPPTLRPTGTLTPSPIPTKSAVPPDTPTSTPRPTGSPTSPAPSARPTEATAVPLTPAVSVPDQMGPEDQPETSSLASRLAPWALGLQIVALMLGIYVALRRPGD